MGEGVRREGECYCWKGLLGKGVEVHEWVRVWSALDHYGCCFWCCGAWSFCCSYCCCCEAHGAVPGYISASPVAAVSEGGEVVDPLAIVRGHTGICMGNMTLCML